MKRNAAGDIGEDRMAILIDGEEKIASWGKAEAGDVLSVGKWEGMRFVAAGRK